MPPSTAAFYSGWHGLTVLAESLREEGRAQVRAEWAKAVVDAQAQVNANAENLNNRLANVEKEAKHEQDRLLAAAAGADRDSLREQLAAYVAAPRRGDAAAPEPAGQRAGQPDRAPLDVLADLFRRADDAAGELARYADRLRAGARERRYDALSSTPP